MTHPYRTSVLAPAPPAAYTPPWWRRWWHALTDHSWADLKGLRASGRRCDVCGEYAVWVHEDEEYDLHGPYTEHCGNGGPQESCGDCLAIRLQNAEADTLRKRLHALPRWAP